MNKSFVIRKIILPFFVLLLLLAAGFMAITFMTGDGEVAPEPWSPGTPLDKESVIIGIIHVDNAESGYSYAHDSGIIDRKSVV